MPIVDVPLIGRSGAIALFALVHVMFANLALGGPLIAVVSEWWGVRKDEERSVRFAHGLARANVVGFSVGATFGVGLVATLTGLWPTGWTRILNMYFWPLALEVVFFFLEGALLYYYVYSWDRNRAHPGHHIAWGVATVAVGLFTLLIINGVAAAMLTPQPDALTLGGGGPDVLISKLGPLYFDNPTWLPLSLHRVVGAISFTGLILATVMGIGALRAAGDARKAHFRWLAGYGLRFGLLPLPLMPLIGFFYVNEIRIPSLPAFYTIMMGEARWAFNMQIVLVGALFLVGNWYLLRLLRGYGLEQGGFDVARNWTMLAGAVAIALGSFVAWYGISQNNSGLFRGVIDSAAIVFLLLVLYVLALLMVHRVHRQGLVLTERTVLTVHVAAESRWASWPSDPGQQPSQQPQPIQEEKTELVQPLQFKEEVNWAFYGEVIWLLLVLCALVALVPYSQLGLVNFPFGQMRPWKFTGLIGLVTFTIPIVALFLQGRARRLGEQDEPPVTAILPIVAGFLVLSIMFVMGYAREAARAPWLIFNQLAAKDDVFEAQGPLQTILPLPLGIAIPLILFGMLLFALLGLMILQTSPGLTAINSPGEGLEGKSQPTPPPPTTGASAA
ncbi:MAG: cytochrome ubiquinol oxidase subunit I [Chloroflexi bacterium]|nr:cytochrome ubiquinol oxidase subunit I [Chloroflexota bacterium]